MGKNCNEMSRVLKICNYICTNWVLFQFQSFFILLCVLYVYMSSCGIVYVCVCQYIHVCMNIHRSELNAGIFLNLCHLFFRQDLSLILENIDSPRLAVPQTLKIIHHLFSRAEVTITPWFYMDLWDPN